jgi:hypothetical protein
MMHGGGKSDFAIVAVKPANKAEQPAAERSAAEPTAAEPAERRAETKGNVDQQSTRRTQSRVSVNAYGKSQGKGRRRGSAYKQEPRQFDSCHATHCRTLPFANTHPQRGCLAASRLRIAAA